MAKIFPFQGVRYNPESIKALSRVVCPPYDVISLKEQESCYRASPYNVIRLELGKIFSGDNGLKNRYARARDFFEKWSSEKILLRDREPSIYIYEHRFKKGGRWVSRLGFIALLKLEGNGRDAIYPHEKTFPSPKEDRFLLLQNLKANVSPLFFLFSDRKRRAERILKRWMRPGCLVADIPSRSERHRVFRLADPTSIQKLHRTLSRTPLLIADGHHRYEVALAFRKKMKEAAGNFVMAYFSNLSDSALTILPIHRVVKGVPGDFESFREKLSDLFAFQSVPTATGLLEALEEKQKGYRFGMFWRGKPIYLLTLKNRKVLSHIDRSIRRSKTWRRLDVTLLHELVLKKKLGLSEENLRQNVLYKRDPKECLALVRRGEYQVCFLLRPPRIQQIQRIALSKERVPQKSTYFYPKPLTGLVMYRFDDGVR